MALLSQFCIVLIPDTAASMYFLPGLSLIPIDEAIVAMSEVGKQMPRELRCTGLGGIAVCPLSKAIEKPLESGEVTPSLDCLT